MAINEKISFKKYIDERKTKTKEQVDLMSEYADYSGIMASPHYIDSIILHKIVAKYSITSVKLIFALLKYFANNIGVKTSSPKIIEELKKKKIKTTLPSLEIYINLLVKEKLIIRMPEKKDKGGIYKKGNDRYFFTNIFYRNIFALKNPFNAEKVLKNIVLIELLDRGYKVFSQRVGSYATDLSATKKRKTEHLQFCINCENSKAIESKLLPLKKIKSPSKKFILTLEPGLPKKIDGIDVINALAFLLI